MNTREKIWRMIKKGVKETREMKKRRLTRNYEDF